MIAITGGGTGGHLAVAKALCEVYNEEEKRPLYIGSTNGQDKRWFEGYPGFKRTLFLPSRGVVNQKGLARLSALATILSQTFTCKAYLQENEVTAVISVGGYAAAPAALAALLLRIPLYIHEQNAVSGRLNSLLRPFSKVFFSAYDAASPVKDYPISHRFFEAYRERRELKTLLFIGGSQGAHFINTLATSLAPWLNARGVRIIHQCGTKDFDQLYSFYKTNNIKVDLFDFTDALHVKMQEADVAIARAGAGSVWELCAAGVPTLFIPFPYAASNHQYFNAKALSDKGLACVLRQSEADVHAVQSWLESVDVEAFSKGLRDSIAPKGAHKIVQWIQHGPQ
jgi:UDP-N-acetylglucosamine--N-acetylmuramyl-(pentapeptide) pyrophosphoryl-undecaprenol N-acetylglucosamine transferase